MGGSGGRRDRTPRLSRSPPADDVADIFKFWCSAMLCTGCRGSRAVSRREGRRKSASQAALEGEWGGGE